MVTIFRCDHLLDVEVNASDEVKRMWSDINEHWDTKSRCLLGVRCPVSGGWRLWARPNYESAFWRAVDLLEEKTTAATFSGSWLITDPTGLIATGQMTWASNQAQPPAATEAEQRALDQLQILGDAAPYFMKSWAEERQRKPVRTEHSPRQILK